MAEISIDETDKAETLAEFPSISVTNYGVKKDKIIDEEDEFTPAKDASTLLGVKSDGKEKKKLKMPLPDDKTLTQQLPNDSNSTETMFPKYHKPAKRRGERVCCLHCDNEYIGSLPCFDDDKKDEGYVWICEKCEKEFWDNPPLPKGYRNLARIGAGAFGVVWKVEDINEYDEKFRIKAIKFFLPTEPRRKSWLQRFKREAIIGMELEHKNIVKNYEQGVVYEGLSYIFMEYVPGKDVSDCVKEDEISIFNSIDIICQTLDGMQYAHSKNVVHRDLKPDNLLLTKTSNGDSDYMVKITDLGLAKAFDRYEWETVLGSVFSLTEDDEWAGTPAYVSPEQIMDFKNVDERADIFSIGLTLYYLLTDGKFIYNDKVLEAYNPAPLQLSIVSGTNRVPIRQRKPKLHGKITNIIEKAIVVDPDKRFQTCEEFLSELRDIKKYI